MITDRERETGLDATLQATFGGGCFWCLHAGFGQVEGVAEVRSGYCGGARPDWRFSLPSTIRPASTVRGTTPAPSIARRSSGIRRRNAKPRKARSRSSQPSWGARS